MSVNVPLHKWRSADPTILIGRRCKVIRLMQRLDDGPCINPLPRNATPQMVEKFIQRSAADTMHIMRQAERSIR